ncbi:MAG: Hpt domain-containing protein [Campylobacterota bacterium]|nr:Hpt domain-containing protein [Campylobacterota bacterium]
MSLYIIIPILLILLIAVVAFIVLRKKHASKSIEREEPSETKERKRREVDVKTTTREQPPQRSFEQEERVKETTKELPNGEYPDFNHSRLMDMGLSQTDANIFVHDLIVQIEDHIPKIEAAIRDREYDEIEHLTHSIKGSATNLGTGGIADVLVDYNTYCKTGKDDEVLLAYMMILKTHQVKLKEQFS